MAQNVERYGIFRKLPDGSPIWVGPESDLEKAKQKMQDLAAGDGMEYFVYDFKDGITVALAPRTGDNPGDG